MKQDMRAYNTGFIAAMLTALAVAVITGLALLPVYRADGHNAYQSVMSINSAGFLGFLRAMHHWSSALLILLGEIYIVIGLFRGAYRKPGQWLWIASIVMFLIGLAMQITGHLLPYDEQGVRTAVVETGIAANAPVVGDMQGNLMRGGAAVGDNTLHLWYMAHVSIFLIVSLILLFLVPSLAKKIGVSVGRRGWIIGSFVVLLIAAVVARPPLGHPATASDFTDSGARPEWYILPLHSLLVLAQNVSPKMAFIGTMVIPGIALLLLIALPWIHKRENVPIARTLGVVGAAAIIGLFAYSFADVAPPVGDQIAAQQIVDAGYPGVPAKLDPALIAQGKVLFSSQGCTDCHRINGQGGKIGPDLTSEGGKNRPLDWQIKHLQDPKSVSPGSTMPKFNRLPQDQLKALAEYVMSLK